MKRKISVVFAITCILFAFSLLLTGCTKGSAADTTPPGETEDENTLSAYVVKNSGNSLLVTADSGLYFVSLDGVKVFKNSKELESGNLSAGMSVLIGYDGNILESYPAQIASAHTVKIVSEAEDKISLYEQALKKVFDESGTFSDLKTVALDFSSVTLTEPQKNALWYVLSNYLSTKTEANVICKSYDELEKDGMVGEEGFKDGVILSVKESEHNTFSVGWYKGPLGAGGYSDCTAKLRGGEWKIDYKTAWIS